MMRAHCSARRLALVVALLTGAATPAPSPAPVARPAPVPEPASPPAARALRLDIETIAVDRRGTWSVGTDAADIFPGRAGLLKRSATLMSRADERRREIVDLAVRVTPDRAPGVACLLKLETEVQHVVAGVGPARQGTAAPERRNLSVPVLPDEEKLIEVYASSTTNSRLALKIRCGEASSTADMESRFVDFNLSLSRADGDEPLQPFKDNIIRAAIGAEAANSFSVNVTLEPGEKTGKRYRREALEVTLVPQLISGGRLQLLVRLRGDLTTVSAEAAPAVHPIAREETFVVSSGENVPIEVDCASSDPGEGWTRVRYKIDVASRF